MMPGKMALWISKGLWTAAEIMILVVLNFPVAEGRDSPQDFVFQFKGECYFTNGTKRVRLLDRLIYNREEVLRFDSNVGEYQAVTEVGRSIAQSWNRQKDVVERARAEVDTVCRQNYQMEKSSTLQRLGAQSESAQSKTLSGIGGFVLGLIFLGLGLIVRHRSQKGPRGSPPTELLH